MAQIHKRSTLEEVKRVLEKYCTDELDRQAAMVQLGGSLGVTIAGGQDTLCQI